MKLPHRRYLVYQAVLGHTDEEISRLLEKDDLVVPDEAELSRLRYELADRPEPFRPFSHENVATLDWLGSQRLIGLIRGKASSREAFRILRSPELRQPVEILLLGGHHESTVAKFVRERHLPEVTENGIAAFQTYFWSVLTLDVEEWARFLERHPMGTVYRTLLSAGPDQALVLADAFLARTKRQFIVTSTLPGPGPGPLLETGTSDSSLQSLITDAQKATY